MVAPPVSPTVGDTILFRPSKKRKIYRQRTEGDAEDTSSPTTTAPIPPPAQSLDELIASTSNGAADIQDGELEGTQVSMAEILRLRKLRRPKSGGVEFKASGNLVRDKDGELVREEGSSEVISAEGGVVRKFAPQTGTVGDVNKHMMAFIDSKLNSRLSVLESSQPSTSTSPRQGGERKNDVEVQRQPAALGKLMEIDLGNEARDRNVERTNQARRKLDGEDVEDEEKPGKKGKVRLGPDGKPWRSRKRRGSDDIKRDRMVEDVLRENRLEIYDEPQVEQTTISDDQAADDRIAEAFRKEFMDAVSQRQRKKAAPPQPPNRTVGGKKEEELKGPKLGGSRSARAAMRETMLKSAKK